MHVVRGRFVEPPVIPTGYNRTLSAAVGGSPLDRAERLLIMEVWMRLVSTTVTQKCSTRCCHASCQLRCPAAAAAAATPF